mmetsp:Transcript_14887/g.19772  ORF Transcript_14887/g.19772 Transcript_14887/m.19772 type:complete len:92 (-) Transcript_14887:26-301(-)
MQPDSHRSGSEYIPPYNEEQFDSVKMILNRLIEKYSHWAREKSNSGWREIRHVRLQDSSACKKLSTVLSVEKATGEGIRKPMKNKHLLKQS